MGALVLVLGLTSGWYLWSQLWFGGSATRLAGTPYTVRVQGAVPSADVERVADGLGLADRWFAEQLGSSIRQPVEVRLARRTPCVPFAFGGGSATAVAQSGSLCIDTDGQGWLYARSDRPPAGPATASSIVVHEAYHVLQAERGCLPGPESHTHAWLVEGAATWIGWQALVDANRITKSDLADTLREWRGDVTVPPLADLESGIGGDAAYAVAYAAVDRLVATTGPSALLDFCDRVGSGMAWTEAFASSFDIEVEEFYRPIE